MPRRTAFGAQLVSVRAPWRWLCELGRMLLDRVLLPRSRGRARTSQFTTSFGSLNIDRSVVDKILENQAELMKSARLAPETKDGKVLGIRLFGIKPDTLLGSLGLQNGDRLESINGFNMGSPEKALEAYARLRTASQLDVTVNRRGAEVSIVHHIK